MSFKPLEILQGETGGLSFSRVQAFGCFLMVVGCTAFLTFKAGAAASIPDSWLTLLGISTGGYLGSKGIAAASTAKKSDSG